MTAETGGPGPGPGPRPDAEQEPPQTPADQHEYTGPEATDAAPAEDVFQAYEQGLPDDDARDEEPEQDEDESTGRDGRPVGQWLAGGVSGVALAGMALFQVFGLVGLVGAAVATAGGGALYVRHRTGGGGRGAGKRAASWSSTTTRSAGRMPGRMSFGRPAGGGLGGGRGRGGGFASRMGGVGSRAGKGRAGAGAGAGAGGGIQGAARTAARRAGAAMASTPAGRRIAKAVKAARAAAAGKNAGRTASGAGRAGRVGSGTATKTAGSAGGARGRAARFNAAREAAAAAVSSRKSPIARWNAGVSGGAIAAVALISDWWRKRKKAGQGQQTSQGDKKGQDETAAAKETAQKTGAGADEAPDPVRDHSNPGDAARAAGQTRRNSMSSGGFPIAVAAAEVNTAAASYEPEDMWAVAGDFKQLPDVFTSVALGLKTYTSRLQSEYPIHDSVVQQIGNLYLGLCQLAQHAGEVEPLFRQVHEADLAREEAPRAGEARWNV